MNMRIESPEDEREKENWRVLRRDEYGYVEYGCMKHWTLKEIKKLNPWIPGIS